MRDLLRRLSWSTDPGQSEEDELVCSRASGRVLFDAPTATSRTFIHESQPSVALAQPDSDNTDVEGEHLQVQGVR